MVICILTDYVASQLLTMVMTLFSASRIGKWLTLIVFHWTDVYRILCYRMIAIFALMGGGGFGWGNRGSGLTQAEMQAGFNHQDEMGQIRGVTYGLSDSTFALNNSILNTRAGLEKTIMQGTYDLGSQLAENRFAQQQCCCETNRDIDSVKAENYQNTCTITSAIHEEAEKTRALITANTMQELRDKLAEKDRELQAAQFNVGQCAQTAMIVNQLRPFPQPAYTVANPYATPTATA